jgi:hypothetical protein
MQVPFEFFFCNALVNCKSLSHEDWTLREYDNIISFRKKRLIFLKFNFFV